MIPGLCVLRTFSWDWSVITPACKMTDVETHETLRRDDEAARPSVLVGYVSEQLANERWELKGAAGAGMHAPRGADFSNPVAFWVVLGNEVPGRFGTTYETVELDQGELALQRL